MIINLIGKTNFKIYLHIVVAFVLIVFSANVFAAKKNVKKVEKKLFIEINYNGDEEISKRLEKLKTNIIKTAKEFDNQEQVAYWDNELKNNILKLMKSYGYYAPIIESKFSTISDKENKIEIDLINGPLYTINKISIVLDEASRSKITLSPSDNFKIKSGQPAIAESIINEQNRILVKLENENCLLKLTLHHEAIINHIEDNVDIKFVVYTGDQANIKEVKFTGLKTINEEYVHKLISLDPGECFRHSKIVEARESLQTSGLFSSTTPEIPEYADKNGEVPIIFNLKERKHRTLKAGLSYGTDLGVGIGLGWEHRNFFSNGENLNIDSFINQKEQIGSFTLTKPFFLQDNQTLKAGINAENTKHRAFDSREGKLYSILERKYLEIFKAGIGGKITISRVKEKKKIGKNFVLLSLPTYFAVDKRNNFLNASKGFKASLDLEPFYEVGRAEENNSFLKNALLLQYYTKLSFHKQSVIALKATIGSIIGEKTSEIPATERYYVGGGSSIRGYAFQIVGPLDVDKNPLGGKSKIETSLEYRYMREDNWGFVLFLDSGNAYDQNFPPLKSKLLHGGGIGLRYNTDFGPIRADIAFPLNRRKGIDDAYQLYFGIGQSF